MSTEAELRRRLSAMAESVPVQKSDVGSIAKRSRRRRASRYAVLVASVGLVVGVAAVMRSDRGGRDSSIVDVVENPDAPATTPARPELEVIPGQVAPQLILAPVEASFLGAGGQFLVPWRDGLLAFGVVNESPPLPDLDGPVAEAFTPRMREVIAASGATTVAGAMLALEDAGLLAQATDIVMGDEDLMALVLPATSGQLYARTSTNGVDWIDVDIANPDGAGFDLRGATRAVSDGEHLVVEYSTPITGAADRVAWTTDLVAWRGIGLPDTPHPTLPPFAAAVSGDYVRSLSLGPSGWVATTASPISIDFLSLLSAEARAQLPEEMITTGVALPEGIEFVGLVEGAREVVMVVPWTETATDYETVRALEAGPTAVWLGSWDGDVQLIQPAQSTVIGTDERFVAFDPAGTAGVSVSIDGQEWETRELPAPGATVVSAVGVEQGIVFQLATDDEFELWVTAPDATDWREIHLPVEIAGRHLWARDTGRGALFVVPDGHIVTMADGRQFLRPSAGSVPRWLVASGNGADWLAEQSPDEWSAGGFPETPPAVAGGVAVVPGPETWLIYGFD